MIICSVDRKIYVVHFWIYRTNYIEKFPSQKEMAQPIARGYVRVSTAMQVDGQSLETQIKRIQGHCDYKGYNLIKIYQDSGISAKDTNRPALQQLMNDMEKGEKIIVADLSRLSRNTRDALNLFEEFKTRGVHFICLNPDIDFSSAVGELLYTIMMAVHRLERQNISSHVSANMQRLSSESKLRSRPPFGYRFVGKDQDLQPEPVQQKVVEKIKVLHASGMGYTKIAKKLNEDGDNISLNNNKKSVKDKAPLFYAQTVKRILADYGVIEDPDRVPIEKRIVSHHRGPEAPPVVPTETL